jgi:hypothetical protein|tara:strand:+ start:241 stop:516 length:276 start_codon:yes stop_codon:yes gene_type:complete
MEKTIDPDDLDRDYKAKSEKKQSENNTIIPEANSLFDAMPLLSKNTKMFGDKESNKSHCFRHQGFGKYRNEINMKQRVNANADEDGEETDG